MGVDPIVAVIESSTTGAGIGFKDATTTGDNQITVRAIGQNLNFRGADGIDFITNNAERMRIDSSGNVGIGSSSPSTFGKVRIDVAGTTTPTNATNVGPSSINLYAPTNGGSTNCTVGIFGWQASQPGIGSGIGFSRENSVDWGSQIRFYTHPSATSNISDLTERMRINSSGNVGIGAANPTTKLHIIDTNPVLTLQSNGASTVNAFSLIGRALDVSAQFNTIKQVSTAGGQFGTLAFCNGPSDTERMRIAANGNVGINTTNPGTFLEVANATTGVANNITTYNSNTAASAECAVDWALNRTGSEAKIRAARITAGKEQTWTTTPSTVDGYLKFLTVRDESLNEAMRIDSNGVLMVGTTVVTDVFSSGTGNEGAYIKSWGQIGLATSNDICLIINRKTASGSLTEFRYNGNVVGSISTNGSSTSYNPASDERLKENIRDYDNALADVMKLKPRKYSWKTDGAEDNGFIAQELLETPEFANRVNPINDDSDDPMYGVDYMKFVAVLTGAIQEQQAMIEELKAEVTALKGA